MSWLHLTNASSGATRNAGTNGDLCTLLDWALPQAGWAIEYTASNARVYRPASGIRNRLHVRHDSAVSGNAGLAVVRGCENASSATVLTDPFPTVAQVTDTNSNWLISNAASTVDRPFHIYLGETFVYYLSNFSGTANQWEVGFFGDPAPALTDPYGTICCVRRSTGVTSIAMAMETNSSMAASNPKSFWMRDITGATKSTIGQVYASGTTLGIVTGTPTARAGFGNRSYREKLGVSDLASTTTTPTTLALLKRGWLPNAWGGLQSGRGTIDDVDTFTDTTYNPLAVFRQLPNSSASSASSIIMEETDTWVAP